MNKGTRKLSQDNRDSVTLKDRGDSSQDGLIISKEEGTGHGDRTSEGKKKVGLTHA